MVIHPIYSSLQLSFRLLELLALLAKFTNLEVHFEFITVEYVELVTLLLRRIPAPTPFFQSLPRAESRFCWLLLNNLYAECYNPK